MRWSIVHHVSMQGRNAYIVIANVPCARPYGIKNARLLLNADVSGMEQRSCLSSYYMRCLPTTCTMLHVYFLLQLSLPRQPCLFTLIWYQKPVHNDMVLRTLLTSAINCRHLRLGRGVLLYSYYMHCFCTVLPPCNTCIWCCS